MDFFQDTKWVVLAITPVKLSDCLPANSQRSNCLASWLSCKPHPMHSSLFTRIVLHSIKARVLPSSWWGQLLNMPTPLVLYHLVHNTFCQRVIVFCDLFQYNSCKYIRVIKSCFQSSSVLRLMLFHGSYLFILLGKQENSNSYINNAATESIRISRLDEMALRLVKESTRKARKWAYTGYSIV